MTCFNHVKLVLNVDLLYSIKLLVIILVLQDEIYTGIIVYVKKGTNRWTMSFMVVNSNNIKHFLKVHVHVYLTYICRYIYVIYNLSSFCLQYLNMAYSDAERDHMFRFTFMDSMNGFIELDLQSTFKNGWRIDPRRLPMRVSEHNYVSFIIIHNN